jgi:hypothetical protein
MRVLLALGAAAGIAAAGVALTAAVSANAQKSAAGLTYQMECFPLSTVGKDINAQASQGWTVTAIVDHASSTGQQCLLVLFQRATP